jgi:hypothetical protein
MYTPILGNLKAARVYRRWMGEKHHADEHTTCGEKEVMRVVLEPCEG